MYLKDDLLRLTKSIDRDDVLRIARALSADEVFRWAKAILVFAIAAVAVYRSVVYIDPNPRYPAFASIFCGLFGVCLVVTGLSIITKGRDAEMN